MPRPYQVSAQTENFMEVVFEGVPDINDYEEWLQKGWDLHVGPEVSREELTTRTHYQSRVVFKSLDLSFYEPKAPNVCAVVKDRGMGFVNTPILGQEALANGNLGVVTGFCDNFPTQEVTVRLYHSQVSHAFSAGNVTLIEPGSGERKGVMG